MIHIASFKPADLGSPALHPAKPRRLPLGEAADGRRELLSEVVFILDAAPEKVRDKTVLESQEGELFPRDTRVMEVLHLVDQTLLEPFAEPLADSSAEHLPVPTHTKNHWMDVGPGFGFVLRGVLCDLNRPHQAVAIFEIRRVVHAPQSLKPIHQCLVAQRLQIRPQHRVGGDVDHAITVQDRFEVEPAATDHDRHHRTCQQILEHGEEPLLVLKDAELRIEIDDVDEVVGHRRPTRGILVQVLSRPEVEAAVHLP